MKQYLDARSDRMGRIGAINKNKIIKKIKDFLDDYGGQSFGELNSEGILFEKIEKDEEWIIEYLTKDNAVIVKYVHGVEVVKRDVSYEDLHLRQLKQINEVLDEWISNTIE